MFLLQNNQIVTTQDVDMLIKDIDVLLKKIYDPKNSEKTSIFSENLPKDEKSLREIREQILKIEKIRLTLAFLPTKEQILSWSEVVKNSINQQNMIFDISIDPFVIAGARIEYQGRILDRTLRKLAKDLI